MKKAKFYTINLCVSLLVVTIVALVLTYFFKIDDITIGHLFGMLLSVFAFTIIYPLQRHENKESK